MPGEDGSANPRKLCICAVNKQQHEPKLNNIAKMEQQLVELQRKFAEEQLKFKQAEARAEEEQRLREEEDQAAKSDARSAV